MFMLLSILLMLGVDVEAQYQDLQNQKAALTWELEHVQHHPGTFYLIIDLPKRTAYLKADANLLRACPIQSAFGTYPNKAQRLSFQDQLLPHTPEPGNHAKLRNRPLPLSFSGRLTHGPRHHSQLYFSPAFLIQSIDLPLPTNIPGIQLENSDIKALGSALGPENLAIFIPALNNTNEPTR